MPSPLFNQKKPAFGQNKVRADIFPRFFGSFSIRKGRPDVEIGTSPEIGRRLDAPIGSGPLLMFIRRSVSVGGKIGSDIFKCGQPIIKRRFSQQRPPADFPFIFFIFVPPTAEQAKSGLFLIP
jgi:hypothetical protein